MWFVSGRDTLDLCPPCPWPKVVIVSRLSDRLRELSESRGMTQAQIADRASELGFSLGKGAISRYFNGKHGENPSNGTLTAFARVLDVPVSDLKDAAAFTGREPFTPDPSSDRLTAPRRAAVNEVIRQLAEANTRAGEEHEPSSPSMNRAGGKPAISEDDGLGAFGGRARGDLDHESINDGAGDNVRRLRGPSAEASAAQDEGDDASVDEIMRHAAYEPSEVDDPDPKDR